MAVQILVNLIAQDLVMERVITACLLGLMVIEVTQRASQTTTSSGFSIMTETNGEVGDSSVLTGVTKAA